MPREPLSHDDVVMKPVTRARVEDACAVVSPGCWCMIPRGFPESQMPDGREAKFRSLCSGRVPPGLIVYVGGEPAGWLGFGPPSKIPRLQRRNNLTRVDDEGTWTIICFRVLRRLQKRGLSRILLTGAIDYAREHGIRTLQAYPADPRSERMNSTNAYVGVVTLFEEFGFERVEKTQATSGGEPRWLVRLEVS